MSAAAGPLWVFAGLLALGGALKVGAPLATQGALRQSGLPASGLLVRGMGLVELGVGIWAIATGGAPAGIAVAVLYGGFALFVVNALVRELPVASCGCFGREDTPPTWIHVVITGLGVGAGVLVAYSPPGSVPAVLGNPDGSPVAFVLLTAAAFAFAYMSLTTLPKTLQATKRP